VANDVESSVVEQIREIGEDPASVDAVYAEALRQQQAQAPALEAEQQRLPRDRSRRSEETRRLADIVTDSDLPLPSVSARPGEAESAVVQIDARLRGLRGQLASLRPQTIYAAHLRETLATFDPLWAVLHQADRIELVQQVVDAVTHNPATSDIQVSPLHLLA